MSAPRQGMTPGVLLRDFLLFNLKFLIDTGKDIVLVQLAAFTFCVDMIVLLISGRRTGWFYRVLRMSERFDLWLNLNEPAQLAGDHPDGLFGVSDAGDDTFLGEMEQLVRRRRDPAQPRVSTMPPGMR